MLRSHLRLLLCFSCFLLPLISADILIQPKSDLPITTGGTQKLLVIVPGALVPAENYRAIAVSIQASTSFRLWVVILSFLGNFPDPITLGHDISSAISSVKSNGFSSISNTDVYVAAHSLGGVFAQSVVKSSGYGGLILLGSYLTNSNPFSSYNIPTLHLAAELDGNTRITRLQYAYWQHQQLLTAQGADPTAIQIKFPVIIIPGMTHSQFCPGFAVKDDIPLNPAYTIPQTDATTLVGQYVAAFLINLIAPTSETISLIAKGMMTTQSLLQGFATAQVQEKDPQWCARQQLLLTRIDTSKLNVINSPQGNLVSLELSKPSVGVSNGIAQINTDSYLSYALNPVDVSTIMVAATQIRCKFKSDAAIAAALGITAPTTLGHCRDINQNTINTALSLVSPAQKARYLSYGVPLGVVDDFEKKSGLTWSAASLGFDKAEDGKTWNVGSPTLQTSTGAWFGLGGMYYCTLLSPAHAAEWILVDSFKQAPVVAAPEAEVSSLPTDDNPIFEGDVNSAAVSSSTSSSSSINTLSTILIVITSICVLAGIITATVCMIRRQRHHRNTIKTMTQMEMINNPVVVATQV